MPPDTIGAGPFVAPPGGRPPLIAGAVTTLHVARPAMRSRTRTVLAEPGRAGVAVPASAPGSF